MKNQTADREETQEELHRPVKSSGQLKSIDEKADEDELPRVLSQTQLLYDELQSRRKLRVNLVASPTSSDAELPQMRASDEDMSNAGSPRFAGVTALSFLRAKKKWMRKKSNLREHVDRVVVTSLKKDKRTFITQSDTGEKSARSPFPRRATFPQSKSRISIQSDAYWSPIPSDSKITSRKKRELFQGKVAMVRTYNQVRADIDRHAAKVMFQQYFPDLNDTDLKLARNPFKLNVADIDSDMPEELIDLLNDSGAHDRFEDCVLSKFWCSLITSYPKLSEYAAENQTPLTKKHPLQATNRNKQKVTIDGIIQDIERAEHGEELPQFEPAEFRRNATRAGGLSNEVKKILTADPASRTQKQLLEGISRLGCFDSVIHVGALMKSRIVKELCKTTEMKTYEKNRTIIKQGHKPEAFYYIISGSLAVYKTVPDAKGIPYTSLKTMLAVGQTFGEIAFLRDKSEKRTATVITKSDCELLKINRNTFEAILLEAKTTEWQEKLDFMRQVSVLRHLSIEELKLLNEATTLENYDDSTVVLGNTRGRQSHVRLVYKGECLIVRQMFLKMSRELIVKDGVKDGNVHKPPSHYAIASPEDIRLVNTHGRRLAKEGVIQEKLLTVSSLQQKEYFGTGVGVLFVPTVKCEDRDSQSYDMLKQQSEMMKDELAALRVRLQYLITECSCPNQSSCVYEGRIYSYRTVFRGGACERCSCIENGQVECRFDDGIAGCKDECLVNPCYNGGTCLSQGSGGFRCVCPPDCTGVRCEVKDTHVCFLPLDNGRACDAGLPAIVYYFEPKADDCLAAEYLGCDGNSNRFESYAECKGSCITGTCCTRTLLRDTLLYGHSEAGYDRYGFRNGYNEQGVAATVQTASSFGSQRYRFQGVDYKGYRADGYNKDRFSRSGYDCAGVDNNLLNEDGLSTGFSYSCDVVRKEECMRANNERSLRTEVISFAAGVTECTQDACHNTSWCRGCVYNGHHYEYEEVFSNGCNQCICTRFGSVQCSCSRVLERKEVRDMTAEEVAAYQTAVKKLYTAGDWTEYSEMYEKHLPYSHSTGLNFLAWHRAMLNDLEQRLQAISSSCTLTIPYFDWTLDVGAMVDSPIWRAGLFGGNGDRSGGCVHYHPFTDNVPWSPCLRRTFNTSVSLPDAVAIEKIKRTSDFSSLNNQLTSGSLLFRLWVGGHAETRNMVYDPVIVSHYAFLDKVWHDWQQRGDNYIKLNGVTRYRPLEPFGLSLDDINSSPKQLCVDYAPLNSLCISDRTAPGRPYNLAKPRAFDPDGRDSAGFDRLGYNRQGYNGDGFDKDGYDIFGFDRYGFNKDGISKLGVTKLGETTDNLIHPFWTSRTIPGWVWTSED
ncbi:LOW QUALITY PROTEIN: uncharacterized protein [Watersipora subatra]|uniref:LOW QUALITY PROTEIN: uncharacterized protein n=1 Tax=Watersipora subatra TaxID=2589382 RepID=UPI00355BCF47